MTTAFSGLCVVPDRSIPLPESKETAYANFVDLAQEYLRTASNPIPNYRAKIGWINNAIRKVKAAQSNAYEQLWWLIKLEKYDPEFSEKVSAYFGLSKEELRQALEKMPQTPPIESLFPKNDRRSPIKDWGPALSNVANPRLLEKCEQLFSKDDLLNKMLLLEADTKKKEDSFIEAVTEIAEFLGKIEPSMERLYLRQKIFSRVRNGRAIPVLKQTGLLPPRGLSEPSGIADSSAAHLFPRRRMPSGYKRRGFPNSPEPVRSEFINERPGMPGIFQPPDQNRLNPSKADEEVKDFFAQVEDLTLTLTFNFNSDNSPRSLGAVYSAISRWLRSKSYSINEGRAYRGYPPSRHFTRQARPIDLMDALSVDALTSSNYRSPRANSLTIPLFFLEVEEISRILELKNQLEGYLEVSGGPESLHSDMQRYKEYRESPQFLGDFKEIYTRADALGLYEDSLMVSPNSMRRFQPSRYSANVSGSSTAKLFPVEHFASIFVPFHQLVAEEYLTLLPFDFSKFYVQSSQDVLATKNELSYKEAEVGGQLNENDREALGITQDWVFGEIEELAEMKQSLQELRDLEDVLQLQAPILLAYLDELRVTRPLRRKWKDPVLIEDFADLAFSGRRKGEGISRTALPLVSSKLIPLLTDDLQEKIREREANLREKIQLVPENEPLRDLIPAMEAVGNEQIELLGRMLKVVSVLESDALPKETLEMSVKYLQTLQNRQKSSIRHSRQLVEQTFAYENKTEFVDILDIWFGLQQSPPKGERRIYPGLDVLVAMPMEQQRMFHAQSDAEIKREKIIGDSRSSDYRDERIQSKIGMLMRNFIRDNEQAPMKIPHAYEFLLSSEMTSLSAFERLWCAYYLATADPIQNASLNKAYSFFRGLDFPGSLRSHLKLADFWSSLPSGQRDANRAFVQEEAKKLRDEEYRGRYNIKFGEKSRKTETRQSRHRFDGFVFSEQGRIKVPGLDDLRSSNNSLILPSAGLFIASNSLDDLEYVAKIPYFAKSKIDNFSDASPSVERASLADLSKAANRRFTPNRVRLALKLREEIEAQKLTKKIMDDLVFRLDSQLTAEDVDLFVWLHENITAGLPNASRFYTAYINELSDDEKRATFEALDAKRSGN